MLVNSSAFRAPVPACCESSTLKFEMPLRVWTWAEERELGNLQRKNAEREAKNETRWRIMMEVKRFTVRDVTLAVRCCDYLWLMCWSDLTSFFKFLLCIFCVLFVASHRAPLKSWSVERGDRKRDDTRWHHSAVIFEWLYNMIYIYNITFYYCIFVFLQPILFRSFFVFGDRKIFKEFEGYASTSS